jgi:phage tail sheath protein FI
MIDPFLRDVKARRGVYEFKVICDETNNTPERIDRNELWATIFIKPTRAAEFIVLQFVALKTGASFEESAQQVINTQV